MLGTLIYVMGPSGSGKDSLISYARKQISASCAQTLNAAPKAAANTAATAVINAQPGLRPVLFVRRYITRPAKAGDEHHTPLTREEFQQRREQGDFALFWKSHGFCYGVSKDIDLRLAEGAVVVVNGSREYLPAALKKYPNLLPLLISVRPEVLRARLEKRGREQAADIEKRLAQAAMPLPEMPGPIGQTKMICLDNSGDLEKAGQRFVELLESLRRVPMP
ncbi:MAG: phosphonate metabolism protein/1,5-bisphosphokinase (PRPP-forming) PhnN [Deltaproteobacteria bacterium]|nr:phosphonate metabolism protein/1,5-bisphosphokinase (PRPP-forming) PhnN [Deltaproteobacteria bacterium]